MSARTARGRYRELLGNHSHLHSTSHTRRFSGLGDRSTALHQVPRRHFTPSNQVVGGVFLHHRRLTQIISCGPRFAQKLAHVCHYSKTTDTIERGEVISMHALSYQMHQMFSAHWCHHLSRLRFSQYPIKEALV